MISESTEDMMNERRRGLETGTGCNNKVLAREDNTIMKSHSQMMHKLKRWAWYESDVNGIT